MILYLIPSPLAENTHSLFAPIIGEIVSKTQYYLVENERTVRRYLGSLGTGIDIRTLHFFVLDKDTSPKKVAEFFSQIPKNESVGVISEAGCPGIADPGALAVAYAHQHGISVVPLPGPSSIFLALMGSGFSGQQFIFHGYLDVKPAERQKQLRQLEQDAQKGQTQIFMETPYRNQSFLEDILKTCSPNTLLCIGVNLTAPDQLLQTKPIAEWRQQPPNLHKKPTMFLLGA